MFFKVRRGKAGMNLVNDFKLTVLWHGIGSSMLCCPKYVCYRTSSRGGGVHRSEGSEGCVFS